MNIIRRTLHKLGLAADPAGPRFIISRDYQIRIPFPQYDSRRPFLIVNYLEGRRLLRRGMLRRPRPVSVRRLLCVHDADYVNSLQDPQAMESILGYRLDAARQDEFLAFQRLVCGGTLLAARLALRHRSVAVNLGGGLHHAARATGSGFCIFNDVALAISHVRELGCDFPILVIDLDLHDGDGTRAIFADDPTVHTFSIHNTDLGQAAALASTSIALGPGVDDKTYLAAVYENLPPLLADTRFGLVFYLAGNDPAADDQLGDWGISMGAMLQRDRFVMDLLRPTRADARIPSVVLLGGGYGRRAWRYGAAFFSWLLTGDGRLDIPLEMELPVDHYRRLARHMRRPGLLPSEEDPKGTDEQDWGLTEADLGGAVTGPAGGRLHNGRFLGLYSRHGLELALEASGLMARLRERGFAQPGVELDLSDQLGHTLRVVSGHRQPVVVIEVKLRVQPPSGPAGRSYLVVEWLLLQDARPDGVAVDRPLLPGQRHPGMGLLRDMAAVLVVAAEKLRLDGLVFTPSHFHLARLARPQGRFPDAADEARYLAFAQAVKGLNLREASAAVGGGRVRDAASGKVVGWEPRPMVIPVTASLKAELHGSDFRGAVKRARTGLKYRLVR
jgi:acetoin utilization deacetylase AcuC-like enzyme